MKELRFDIVIVGTGLGASAIAHRLGASDASIVMVPGVGCARFKHLDGGVIPPGQLTSVFDSDEASPVHQTGGAFTFRRDQLETWAIDQVRDRVTILDDFADLRVLPHVSGDLSLHEETGHRVIIAGLIVLTEGASPKIGIAAGIRRDFEPEELLHFGRALVRGVDIAAPVAGEWRTSWNMPAWYSAIPHPDGTIVSASARIENIMRVGRDGREVLVDFLKSPLASGLGLPDTATDIGMELVPHGQARGPLRLGTHRMLIAPDANGSIDPRDLDRFARVLTTGAQLGDFIEHSWPHKTEWNDAGADLVGVFTAPGTPYHDSSETGFIEEGAGTTRGFLSKVFKR